MRDKRQLSLVAIPEVRSSYFAKMMWGRDKLIMTGQRNYLK